MRTTVSTPPDAKSVQLPETFDFQAPYNGKTKEPYSGGNILALEIARYQGGWYKSEWYTYLQAKELGGQVRKGEHGTPIIRPVSWVKEADAKEAAANDSQPTKRTGIRCYYVFNFQQIVWQAPEVSPLGPVGYDSIPALNVEG
jgi:antirestriction protein ArdC